MADLSASQAAERLKAPPSTVRAWCNQGLFPNARYIEGPTVGYWVIPEADLEGFTPPKRGRRPKPKTTKEQEQPA